MKLFESMRIENVTQSSPTVETPYRNGQIAISLMVLLHGSRNVYFKIKSLYKGQVFILASFRNSCLALKKLFI